ncbi:MAG: aldo/keto reductase [Solobacterium sp.]|nr:aldo/keto reductase [Solobacterium sp.]
MKYKEIGSTGILISDIGLGGMSFGKRSDDYYQWTLEEKETEEMIAHAFDLGVNFIDTANQYSGGTSEEYIGKALRHLGIPRDQVVLASKVYFNEGKLSRNAILREIDGTLKRLGTDYLDLYQIHRFDYDTPIEETMETLDSLVKAGKVRALGASSMYAYQLHNMQICAMQNGWTMFSAMQNHYNLLYREDEREMIPVCRQYHVSLIPYSPLAGGHLAHAGWTSDSLRSQSDRTIRRRYDHAMESDLKIVERVDETARKYHVSMSEIALAWLLSKSASPIVGATKVSHFDDAVRAVGLILSEEDIRYLEELYLPHQLKGPAAAR